MKCISRRFWLVDVEIKYFYWIFWLNKFNNRFNVFLLKTIIIKVCNCDYHYLTWFQKITQPSCVTNENAMFCSTFTFSILRLSYNNILKYLHTNQGRPTEIYKNLLQKLEKTRKRTFIRLQTRNLRRYTKILRSFSVFSKIHTERKDLVGIGTLTFLWWKPSTNFSSYLH